MELGGPRTFQSPLAAPRNKASIPGRLQNAGFWSEWVSKALEARNYFTSTWPKFHTRDRNYDDMVDLRHGNIPPNIPPSHREIIRRIGSRRAGEILERLVSILTSVFPDFTFHADGATRAAGLRASELSTFWRSFWLAVEDRTGVPVQTVATDQQISYGGFLFKVVDRLDRWRYMPEKKGDESDRDFAFRLKQWKARNLPFDVIVPEYNTLYYDNTTDGLIRVCEKKKSSVYDIASAFGGEYDETHGQLRIPVYWTEYDQEYGEYEESDTIVFGTAKEVEYIEYWKMTNPADNEGWCVYVINDTPVRVEYFDTGLPYFLGLGAATSSPDPGLMGLPILYNAFNDFLRLLDLTAMEDSFLYKHGYARLKHKLPADAPGAVEPEEMPDQESEEETIGEVLETKGEEDWAYLVPANVSALFADAKNDVKGAIDEAAMADVLTGRLPPSGTTGWLMSQIYASSMSKYVPLLKNRERAMRMATLYMQDKIDADLQSPVVVHIQGVESTKTAFAQYKPGFSRGNHNLEIKIDAPIPSDKIQRAQFLIAGNERGYIARERVQREAYDVENPAQEDEKIDLDVFRQFYRPISIIKAMKRAGRFDEVMEAASAGALPPQLQEIALQFASGPDGQMPPVPGANPNGVIQAQPGLGEPGVPTVGATQNAAPVVAGGGRATGAPRRPGGPRGPATPAPPAGSG